VIKTEPDFNLTPDEILDRASKLIVEPGIWAQGRLGRAKYGELYEACALGTMIYVLNGDITTSEGDWPNSLSEAMLAMSDVTGIAVPTFNDHVAKDAEQVATAVRDAATSYRIKNA